MLPVSLQAENYARSVYEKLKTAGIRCSLDVSTDRINGKIKTAQLKKIPYMLVVGEKEESSGSVAVRFRDARAQQVMKVDEFIGYVNEKESTRFAGI